MSAILSWRRQLKRLPEKKKEKKDIRLGLQVQQPQSVTAQKNRITQMEFALLLIPQLNININTQI